LLLRSAEAKPRFFTSVLKSKLPHWRAPLIRAAGGGAYSQVMPGNRGVIPRELRSHS